MPLPPPIALILAAGASRRMGRSKALLPVAGRPLLLCHLDALSRCCGRARVVVGAHAAAILAALQEQPPPLPTRLVDNPAWMRTGPADSLRLGLAGLDPGARVVITPVDVPPVPERVLSALLEQPGSGVPLIGGRRGHPVVALVGPTRCALAGGTLRQALLDAREVPVDWPDGLLNLNTPEDWMDWVARQPSPKEG